MAQNYADDVASVSCCTGVWKVIARWKGSLYQAMWLPVSIFLCTYICIGLVFKYGFTFRQQDSFVEFARYCDLYANKLPVAMALGFFTSTVMNRWWSVCTSMPDTDGVITQACLTIPVSEDRRSTAMVRAISRYVLLSWVLNMRIICGAIRRRHPTLKVMQDAGLLLPHETALIGDADLQCQNSKPLLPISWCFIILRQAVTEGRTSSEDDVDNLINALERFKNCCDTVLKYYFTNIPLVATQAVTLIVHTFGLATLFGKQFVDVHASRQVLVMDSYFPVFPLLQYVGYLGWLKLAELLINPFGDDEDDLELVNAWKKNRQNSACILTSFETRGDYPEA